MPEATKNARVYGLAKKENKAKTAQRVDKNDLWAIIMNYFDT